MHVHVHVPGGLIAIVRERNQNCTCIHILFWHNFLFMLLLRFFLALFILLASFSGFLDHLSFLLCKRNAHTAT